ncbi:MAG: TonB-dependent receptor [Cyclobacteriaceae bacterium]|nr:TonB-dependent receptor [Cyclobacteriaceae bacterium]MCH8515915.1 TonB-dependent receptor [Cyclobacteriaceae bacterium]
MITIKNKMLLLIIFLFPMVGFAQVGSLKGMITDADTNEEIVGANIILKQLLTSPQQTQGGAMIGGASDINGEFLIQRIPAGTYNVTVSSIGYNTRVYNSVSIEPGKMVNITASLSEETSTLDQVVVVGARETNSEISVISEVRYAKSVINGVSAQQISRLPDNDAAQVLKRVPGISVVDNKFIRVRGVDDRYNNVMINGIIAPSTEINKRTFSFDLIPAGMIDRMLVSKSGSADLPGDFAGGMIRVYTAHNVFENSTDVSFGFGYRAGTTFGSFQSSETSNTDFLGFDGGLRNLPSSFPSTDELTREGTIRAQRAEAGRMLNNNFGLQQIMATPDQKIRVTVNRNHEVGKYKVTSVNSIGYSRESLFRNVNTNKWFEIDANRERALPWQDWNDENFSQETTFNLVSNWSWRASSRNKYDLRMMFNQVGLNNTIIRSGDDFQQRTQDDLLYYSFQYLSRSIGTVQMKGTHELKEDDSSLEWLLGFNVVNRNEPDFRRFRTFRSKTLRGTEEPFVSINPPSSNLFDNSRFYSDMLDLGYSAGVDYNKIIGHLPGGEIQFKSGLYGDIRTRSFNSRYFSYLIPAVVPNDIAESISRLPLAERFAPENIDGDAGWILAEGTRGIDSYDGISYLGAAYVQSIFPFTDKSNLSAGIRYEYFVQQLNTEDGTGAPLNINNQTGSPLPFLNYDYSLTDRSVLRAGYGRSVNRPEFREIAPFLFYDFEFNWNINGNPDLKVAEIDNIDLRYEFYPDLGDMISVGAFYKRFTNPIENVLRVVTENQQINFINAPSAYVGGVEFEMRKSLRNLIANPFLSRFTFIVNTSWIQSEVNLGSAAVSQDRQRPLQGQSPYIINSVVSYDNEKKGFSVNAAFNMVGSRIFAVGDLNFPTIYELPRGALDIKVAKQISPKWEGRLELVNVLNTAFRFYQDTNRDGQIKDELLNFFQGSDTREAVAQDDVVMQYRTGQLVNFQLNYRILGK